MSERDPVGSFYEGDQDYPLEHASPGALRIARQHLLKAADREEKALERLDYDMDNAPEMPEDSVAFFVSNNVAGAYEAVQNIEKELDRRNEPYTK